MTKGKYKRKGKNAQNEAEQGGLPIPLMNKERSQELKTNDTEHPGGDRRAQPTPTWYARAWKWIKRDYVTAVSIAVFTGVLAAVSIAQGCLMRRQLATLEQSQRPFIFAEAVQGNDWLQESEHTLGITITLRNFGAFPALNVAFSQPHIWMGPNSESKSEVEHCKIEYPPNARPLTLQPMSPALIQPTALPTVYTDYITDKERIKHGTDAVLVYGGIRYTGINSGDFETIYCFTYLTGGNYRFGSCDCNSMK
jgi:hypothetical protein